MLGLASLSVLHIVVALGGCAVLAFVVANVCARSKAQAWLTGGVVCVAASVAALLMTFSGPLEWRYMKVDGLTRLISAVTFPLFAAVSVYSMRYMRESDGAGRYYGLLLLMELGVFGMSAAQDTLGLYFYFELMAVSSYSLVSFRKDQWAPVEAGLKYVVLNATGSGLALLGICLAFLYRGSTSLGAVGWIFGFREEGIMNPGVLAVVLTVVGMGVKTAMVPLHTWLPDAYAVAPAGVSAALSGIVTEMGLVGMLRLVLGEFPGGYEVFGSLLVIMGLASMTVGNLGALAQRDIKRILAYSSIAQIGFMMAGIGFALALGVRDGMRGSLFHVMTHGVMKACAFLAAGILIDEVGSRDIRQMRGLGHRRPLPSLILSVACLSLAGIPGFAGFMSKWWIYRAGFESGVRLGSVASAIAIGNSIISLGYYLPVIWTLFRHDADVERESVLPESPGPQAAGAAIVPWEMLPVVGLGVAIMVLGLYPVPVLKLIDSAVISAISFWGGV